jgi:hypothetical protein
VLVKVRDPTFFQNHAIIILFQQNNITDHTATDTVNFLRTNYIVFIDNWPTKSRYENPIEYLWDKTNYMRKQIGHTRY